MYTLLYLKWIINRNLLYSTGSSAQCGVAARVGRGVGRVDTCIWMAESLHCSPETITTLTGSRPIKKKKVQNKKKWMCEIVGFRICFQYSSDLHALREGWVGHVKERKSWSLSYKRNQKWKEARHISFFFFFQTHFYEVQRRGKSIKRESR